MNTPRTITVEPGFIVPIDSAVLPPPLVRRFDGPLASLGGAVIGLSALASYLLR